MKNKKGSAIAPAFIIGIVALLFVIFLGITVFTFSLVNNVLNQDIEIGQVNLGEISQATFGQIVTGIVNNADTIGIIFLFGMLLLMILNGYYFGSKSPKLFFIIDIFLLALFFIPSIYISQVYNTFISSSTVFQSTFIDVIPKSSKFLLNLPIVLAVTGIITTIISYSGVKGEGQQGDGANVQGY